MPIVGRTMTMSVESHRTTGAMRPERRSMGPTRSNLPAAAPLAVLMDSVATNGQQDLRRRLGRAVRIWREVTDAPLPRLNPDAPDKQVAALEMEVVELLAARADPECAADLQFQLAELTEGRPSDDPVSRRARAIRPMLLDLDERRSGSSGGPLPPPAES